MPGSSRPRIMMVDDEPEILTLMRTVLHEWGFEALTCASGNQALLVLRAVPVDLIITDLTMVDGDGESLLRAIANGAEPRPPVILVTAREDMRRTLMAAGAYAVHGKPCALDELLTSIQGALGQAR